MGELSAERIHIRKGQSLANVKKFRTSGFCLGTYRGKRLDASDQREAKHQRDIYQIGSMMLRFARSRDKNPVVRIAAYEVPIYEHAARTESIDLLGFDREFNIYLIELKRSKSSEPVSQVVNQIDRYIDGFEGIRDHLIKEFNDVLYYPVKEFGKVNGLLLAPESYYRKRDLDFIHTYKGEHHFGFWKAADLANETAPLTVHFKK